MHKEKTKIKAKKRGCTIFMTMAVFAVLGSGLVAGCTGDMNSPSRGSQSQQKLEKQNSESKRARQEKETQTEEKEFYVLNNNTRTDGQNQENQNQERQEQGQKKQESPSLENAAQKTDLQNVAEDRKENTSKRPLLLSVYKSDTCGCCTAWMDHLHKKGFVTESHTDNSGKMKDSLGVPENMRSCHTAVINHQFIEGHVPAEDIKTFLSHPAYREAKGIAVPGMPIGSPGMEMGGRVDPYNVYIIHKDGQVSVFAKHK